MNAPLDVKEAVKTIVDVEAARNMPVHVIVMVDPSAPEDVAGVVRAAFATTAPNGWVEYREWSLDSTKTPAGADLGVLVAGLDANTGALAAGLRAAGVPALTVTSMPRLVCDIAADQGCDLIEEDVVAPKPYVDGTRVPQDDPFNVEPYPLTIDRTRTLVDAMGAWIAVTFAAKGLAFAIAFDFVRRPYALECINSTSLQNAGIGAVFFIPGADLPLMTMNQAKMVLQIAGAYGVEMGASNWKDLAAVIAGGFACRSVARELAPLVPGAGWLVKAGVGAAGTQAIGRAALAYLSGTPDGRPSDGRFQPPAQMGRAAHDFQVGVMPYVRALGAASSAVADVAVESARDACAAAKPTVDAAAQKAHPVVSEIGNYLSPVLEGTASFVAAEAIDCAHRAREAAAPLVDDVARLAGPRVERAFPHLAAATRAAAPRVASAARAAKDKAPDLIERARRAASSVRKGD